MFPNEILLCSDPFLGGVVTTANPLYTAEELEHQLTDSRAKYMITIPLFVDKAREAMKNAKLDEKNLYVLGDVPNTKPFMSLVKNDGQVRKIITKKKFTNHVLTVGFG